TSLMNGPYDISDQPAVIMAGLILFAISVTVLPPAFAAPRIREWLLAKFIVPKIAPTGRCNRCGYAPDTLPLTGDGVICPECGTAYLLLTRQISTPAADDRQEPG
ncbi:MAG: hypothetical protein AAF235_06470, partial [Planctomycetota bacterium]